MNMNRRKKEDGRGKYEVKIIGKNRKWR